MSRTNYGLRLSLVVKCLIVINLSPHEDISIVHYKFDYGMENNKGTRYVYNVIKKTWSRYFLGGLLFSGARYFRGSLLSWARYFGDLLEATKF